MKRVVKVVCWSLVVSALLYILVCPVVAYWMASGGWNYEDHKIFFHLWTLGPTLGSFILMVLEGLDNG